MQIGWNSSNNVLRTFTMSVYNDLLETLQTVPQMEKWCQAYIVRYCTWCILKCNPSRHFPWCIAAAHSPWCNGSGCDWLSSTCWWTHPIRSLALLSTRSKQKRSNTAAPFFQPFCWPKGHSPSFAKVWTKCNISSYERMNRPFWREAQRRTANPVPTGPSTLSATHCSIHTDAIFASDPGLARATLEIFVN